jgi:hypothetical protein
MDTTMLVGKNWKLESDELNVTLYQRFERKGDASVYWRPHSYYSNISSALHGLVDIEVSRTGFKDVETVIEKIKELHQIIEDVFYRYPSPEVL